MVNFDISEKLPPAFNVSIMIIILLLFCALTLSAADYKTDTITFHSNILEENRTILIFTPSGLKESDTVTAIYMLDGEYSAYRFEEILKEKHYSYIGIGIVNTDRRRDLLPGIQSDRFLDFIDKELIPAIDSMFVNNQRILYGHSFGGAFTLNSMINKPGRFNKYIASSPIPILDMVDSSIYKQINDKLKTDFTFYFSYGSKDMKQVKIWNSRLYESLEDLELNRIKWKREILEGKNHNTSAAISLISGLRY